jgi:hypothetical protein
MPSEGIRDSLIQKRQQQAGSVDDQRRSEDEQKEHQRITSHLLVEVEQIGVVFPELVDLERAVMEDCGCFFFTATANCVCIRWPYIELLHTTNILLSLVIEISWETQNRVPSCCAAVIVGQMKSGPSYPNKI